MAEDSTHTPADQVTAQELRTLLKSVRRIVRANDLQSRFLARSIGLTGPQLVILMAVAELGEVTTKALADHVDLSAATVVTVLETLEQRAIVQRYRSADDRRIVFTRLTQEGQRLISHAPGLFGSDFTVRYAGLPAEKRHLMQTSLLELADLMSRPADRLPAAETSAKTSQS